MSLEKAAKRHIIAIGDNGFRKDPNTHELNQYILKQAAVPRPRICFIPTASGDDLGYIQAFSTVFQKYDCEVSHFSLFRDHPQPIEPFLLSQNILYVGGGNTRNLLALWREWGLDQIIRKAYDQGIVLAGGSAGSLCWFESGVTDSIPGRYTALKNCLGFLKGSNCPHYDAEEKRRPTYHHLLEAGELGPGLAADEGVGLHFINETFTEAVTAYPGKRAFRLSLENGKAVEAEVPVKSL